MGQIVGSYTDRAGKHGFLDTNGTFSNLNIPAFRSDFAVGNDLSEASVAVSTIWIKSVGSYLNG